MGHWLLSGSLACSLGYPIPPVPIGIMELQAKTLKIFGFKGVIWKIFRNKDLALLAPALLQVSDRLICTRWQDLRTWQ